MGNAHVLRYRAPAIAVACLALAAVGMTAASGTTCSFVEISARSGRVIAITEGSIQVYLSSTSIGILCEGDYYQRDGDQLWTISYIFFLVALAFGAILCSLAWALSFVLAPNDTNWKLVSVLSALVAVLQMPVFLIFEAEPCSLYSFRQKCSLTHGSYLLIASTVIWVAITLLTQCLDPPRWAIELNAWKVHKRDSFDDRDRVILSDEEDPNESSSSASLIEGFRRWHCRSKRWTYSSAKLGMSATDSASRDEEEGGMTRFPETGSYYADSNNSRLVLKVLPNGRRPGDDQKSLASFGDLDGFSEMEEEPHSLAPSMLLGEKLIDEVELDHTNEDPSIDNDEEPAVRNVEKEPHDFDIDEEPDILGVDLLQDSPSTIVQDPPATESEWNDELLNVLAEDYDADTDDGQASDQGESRGLLEEVKKSPEHGLSSDAGARVECTTGLISVGIRALTNRIKRESSHKVKGGKSYSIMEDDEEGGNYIPPASPKPPALPEKVEWQDMVEDEDDWDTETSELHSSVSTAEKKANKELQSDWNALHVAASAGVALDNDEDSGEDDHEEPEPIYYSSDETRSSLSLSSLGHQPDGEQGDSSSLSSNSFSDSSGDEGKILLTGRPSSMGDGRRRRRRTGTFSCGGSVSSRTSLLDYTIDEETATDLKEFESGDEGNDPRSTRNRIERTLSAPAGLGDAGIDLGTPYALSRTDSYPTTVVQKARNILARNASVVSDSSTSSAVIRLTSISHLVPLSVGCGAETDDTDDRSRSHAHGFVSDTQRLEGYTPSADETSSFCQRKVRRSRSFGAPRSRLWHSSEDDDHSVASQPPPTLWRDERLYKVGIHCEINIVSDDSSSDNRSLKSGRSVRSNLSRRARRARRERLQHETEEKTKRRARSLDSRILCCRSKTASIVPHESSEDSTSVVTGRSTRSNISRRARRARIRRLQHETDKSKKPRSRSLDTHRTRIFSIDPSVGLILVESDAGVDHGPDEASL